MPKTVTLPKFLSDPDPGIYFSENYIVLDFETTNKDKGSALVAENRIVLSGWIDAVGKYKDFRGSEFEIQELVDACETADFIVAHNAKFELQWLARAGLDITNVIVFCTQIGEYVLNGNRRKPVNLDDISARRGLGRKGQLVSKMIKAGICPSEIPERWLAKYCKRDVVLTKRLFNIQLEELHNLGLLPVMYSRCLLTPALADIETNGMCLDSTEVVEEYNKLAYEYADVMQKLDKMTGGINPKSPKQVAEFLYDVLKFPVPKIRGEEKRTTGADVIAKFKAKTQKQKKFLELKKLQGKLSAKLTKTITPAYNCVRDTTDGILYANFNQTVTQTHRLSSSGKQFGMQFQNFPRAYKRLFKARHPDWKIGETDSAQLEFRTAVILAHDKQGIEDVLNGADVHNLTSQIIYAEEYEECGGDLKGTDIGKRIRQDSKPHSFKPLYGGTRGTEREEAYYAAFREKYADITAMQEEWKHTVLREKQLTTITGLIFYWPDTEMTRNGYITNSTNICNYPVQMFATADIMPISVRFLWQYFKILKLKSFIVNTVHDSAISEIHPKEEKIYRKYAELSFTKNVQNYMTKLYNVDFCVPLEEETKLGDHWGS